MYELSRRPASCVCADLSESNLLLRCTEVIKNNGGVYPEEGHIEQYALLTALLVYLYRLKNYQNYTVKFSKERLNQHGNNLKFKNSFAVELPLSIEFEPSMTFMDALREVAVKLNQLVSNKTYLFDSALQYPELTFDTASTVVSIVMVDDVTTFQLAEDSVLTIAVNEAGTKFSIYSRKDAFPECVNVLISNLSLHIMTMMTNIVDAINTPLNKVNLLTKTEKQRILLDWNNTKVEFPNQNKPVHYFFEEQVLKTPHRIAVTFENKHLTFAELNQKANQVARYLTNQGVLPDTIIAICAKRSLEMVIGMLGILKSGCAYLPLDPSYPAERLTYILSDSNSPLLLTDSFYAKFKTDSVDVKTIQISEILEQPDIEDNCISNTQILSEHLAYVIYTSGTTGKPKGVEITHRSLVNHMLWMLSKFNFSENDIFMQRTSLCFDASVWEFFAPLLCGGRLIMASNEAPQELGKLIQLVKKYNVTVLQLVPSMLREFLTVSEFHTCDSLKKVFCGGEALPADTVHLFLKNIQADLYNLYGPTETTIQVTTYSYNRLAEPLTNVIIIGKPIDNVEVYVLDKHLNPVPIGVSGELYIGGKCLSRGYLNRKELNLEKFIQNPFHPNSRLYKTGDMVRWLADGNLEYLGRLDEQIKLNGFRIEVSEIETTLLQHEGIRECAVVAQQRANKNGVLMGDKHLAAYYVKQLDLNHSDTEDYVRTWETIYQSAYSSLDINNFKHNAKGWNSSYTDEAIDEADILEWVNSTTDRINQLNPKIILEIGSGSGLILFNMIDNCSYYYATDFSKNVIDYTNNVIQKFGYSDKISTIACTADELPYNQLEKKYDTVVINSVVQYFPSLEYLEMVIMKAISNMQVSGQIFIGDVRDFRLLKCFHYSVQAYKRNKVTKSEVNYFSLRDKELLVSPEYFIYLKTINENISHVELLPKTGKANHEMNNYRYDVILHIHKNNKEEAIGVKESSFVDVLDFENYIASNNTNDYMCIRYPNKRIAKDYIEYNRIYNSEFTVNASNYDNLLSIDQISEIVTTHDANVKYFIDVHDPFYLNIIIFRNHISQVNFFINYDLFRQPVSKVDLASKPLATSKLLENQFSNELKQYLSNKLPSYMVPGRYIPLEKLPLNANGKVDRKALIESEFIRSESYVAPRNEIENQVCHIWAEVLGLPEDELGIQDDFFNLGGHSLSALRTLSLIKNFFLVKLPTRTLFDYPTVEKLADLIQKAQQNPTFNTQKGTMLSPVIALQKNGFKAPLFLIHPVGGTIFWYKTLSRYLGNIRPIYAIQDPGIDANELLFRSVQEMARFYLKAIQKIQPTGPYMLAGASFGATLAIEIANQLLKAGEKVNFIGLMDGWPVYSKKFWEKEFFEQLMLQQFQRMDSQFSSQGINDIEFLLKLQRHRMSMLRYYKIPFINAKLTFFKAEELWPVFKEMVLPLNCWQPYSNQAVDFHLVPGNHETMFWEPHVQELAKQINECLNKIEIQKLPESAVRKISHIRVVSNPIYK